MQDKRAFHIPGEGFIYFSGGCARCAGTASTFRVFRGPQKFSVDTRAFWANPRIFIKGWALPPSFTLLVLFTRLSLLLVVLLLRK